MARFFQCYKRTGVPARARRQYWLTVVLVFLLQFRPFWQTAATSTSRQHRGRAGFLRILASFEDPLNAGEGGQTAREPVPSNSMNAQTDFPRNVTQTVPEVDGTLGQETRPLGQKSVELPIVEYTVLNTLRKSLKRTNGAVLNTSRLPGG